MKFPKHYSLVSEGKDTFEVHDGRDNKKFHVSKKGLHPANQLHVLRLPKYADGGEVKKKDLNPPKMPDPEQAKKAYQGLEEGQTFSKGWENLKSTVKSVAGYSGESADPEDQVVSPARGAVLVPDYDTAPVGGLSFPGDGKISSEQIASPELNPALNMNTNAPIDLGSPNQAPMSTGSATPPQPPSPMDQFNQNTRMQAEAIEGKGQAQFAQGKQEAEQYQQSIDSMARANYVSQQALWNLNEDNKTLANKIATQEIDANHYFTDIGTGGKIATAIALALGGIGAGLTKGPNLAYESLQKAIDRDIEAQKADLGKKQTLLSHNIQRYGNMASGIAATAMQLNAMTQGQIAQTAARSGGQINEFNAKYLLGQFQNQALKDGMEFKKETFKSDLLYGPNSKNIDPETKIRAVVPEGQQEHVLKEYDEAQKMSKAKALALGAFDEASKINTISNRLENPVQSGYQIDALIDPVVAKLSKDTAGRFTEQDAKMLDGLVRPKLSSNDETRALQRRKLEETLNEKMNFPRLKAWGITVPGSTVATPDSSLVERQAADGKVWLFDPNTKKAVRPK